jgi:LysR family glycine cleavage system transcriptional activator
MRRLPPLNPLKSFEAVARTGSVARAAAELFVTAGAVSRQLAALEESLGMTLFERGHRRITPTPAAADYLDGIRDAFDRIEAATARLTASTRRRPLSVCAYPSFALRWLMPRWGRFYDRHPDIDVQLTTSLAPVDFARDGYDAAVRIGAGEWSGLGHMFLTPTTLFPVCAPSLLEGARPLACEADLAYQTLLHSAPRPLDWHRWLAEAGAAGADVGGVDPARGPRFESLNLAFQAALAGSGVAIAIGAIVADELAQGRLVRPFTFARQSRRAFWLVWPERNAGDSRLTAFRDWLAVELAAVKD